MLEMYETKNEKSRTFLSSFCNLGKAFYSVNHEIFLAERQK